MIEASKSEKKPKKLGTTKAAEQISDLKKQRSKKSPNAFRSFIFSPTFNVVALALLIVAVFAGIRLFSNRRNPAQVAFVEKPGIDAPERGAAGNRVFSAPEIFRGEVYDTTVRLRETGALGMAISLSVFADFSEKKIIPANVESVITAVQTRGLMPPKMVFENGKLESASSVFFVRYNRQPLAFEILSSPKQGAIGQSPSLMMRFPLASLDKRTITYFQSASTNQVQMPEPFAPLERIVAAGWTIEQWRGELLPKNENASRLLEEEKRLLAERINR